MNSALVQLLPVDRGGGYKNTSSEPAAIPDDGKRFDDVFEQATSEAAPDKSAETDAVGDQAGSQTESQAGDKTGRKTESGKTRKDAAVDKSRKDRKDSSSNETEAAAVTGVATDGKAVDKLKKSLKDGETAGEIEKDGKTESGVKGFEAVKRAVKDAREASGRGAEKTALESGIAGLSKGDHSAEADEKESASAKTNESQADKNSLAGKLTVAAAKVNSDLSNDTASAKPGIELVGVTAADAAADKKASGKSGKNSKLRIVDHRTVSAAAGKSGKSTALNAGSSFGSEFEYTGRTTDFSSIGSQSDTSRADGKTAETKMFQSSVLSQLKDGINSQIVKQAGIVVKGNGTGEIKLVMKPESLGKVRIQLSLNDNHIAGRIIVENNMVREIFESNLENLYKAFGSEGFENGGLEVSVQGKGQDADRNSHKNSRGFSGRAAKAMDEAVPEVVSSEWRNNAVNMVV